MSWKYNGDDKTTAWTYLYRAAVGAGLVGAGVFLSIRIRTSRSNEWLVRTGLQVPDLQVGKMFVAWPYQAVRVVSMQAHTFRFTVTAMTSEKLSIDMPMTWSVAVGNTETAVTAFSRRVSENTDLDAWFTDVVLPTLLGESRTIAANLGVEDVFKARDEFTQQVRELICRLGHVAGCYHVLAPRFSNRCSLALNLRSPSLASSYLMPL